MADSTHTKEFLAQLISSRLKQQHQQAKNQYDSTKNSIGYFFIEDLLPVDIAKEIHRAFPRPEEMNLNKSLREHKHIAAQMDQYHPLLEQAIYAFQDAEVVSLIQSICGISKLEPDTHLYAGGISTMKKGQFLNPHLDNSHDKDRNRWRVLNLLYYVNPNWENDFGGDLELWPDGVKGESIAIPSSFNRLVVMATHQGSWHAVRPVQVDESRNCVSNYYFSPDPLRESDRFHVTTFRGWPHQRLKNGILKMDSTLRMGLRKLFRKGVRENPHVYKKKKE